MFMCDTAQRAIAYEYDYAVHKLNFSFRDDGVNLRFLTVAK